MSCLFNFHLIVDTCTSSPDAAREVCNSLEVTCGLAFTSCIIFLVLYDKWASTSMQRCGHVEWPPLVDDLSYSGFMKLEFSGGGLTVGTPSRGYLSQKDGLSPSSS